MCLFTIISAYEKQNDDFTNHLPEETNTQKLKFYLIDFFCTAWLEIRISNFVENDYHSINTNQYSYWQDSHEINLIIAKQFLYNSQLWN